MQAVDVEAPDLQTVFEGTAFVPAPHRLQEMREFDVAPHPARKADEGVALSPDAVLADKAVEFGRIRPVALDGQDAEPVVRCEPVGDRRARLVELGRSVRGLAEQHDLGVGEHVETGGESVGRVQVRQRLRAGAHALGQIAHRQSHPGRHRAISRRIGSPRRVRRVRVHQARDARASLTLLRHAVTGARQCALNATGPRPCFFP